MSGGRGKLWLNQKCSTNDMVFPLIFDIRRRISFKEGFSFGTHKYFKCKISAFCSKSIVWGRVAGWYKLYESFRTLRPV